ncbi:replication-associated recombination protein A [bacterium]|nr:replication-associated recombination protein A [bacterium]
MPETMPLFDLPEERDLPRSMPLAARMRPRTFAEFVGQDHLVGEGRVFRKCIESDQLPSVILWGPPGSGKTTLAYIIASITSSHFSPLSAVSAGVADLRRVIDEAKKRLRLSGQRTILFVDEIHRFNKAQQDAFLPHVESGLIHLIGATTENPSFEVISPLLSRCRVYTLDPLTEEDLLTILRRALKDRQRGLARQRPRVAKAALEFIAGRAGGDARVALSALEFAVMTTNPGKSGLRSVSLKTAEEALQKKALVYDKAGDQHFNIISALHKSLRGSDPDAALYWLARMLDAGEDPLYIARRMVRFASEDIGNADPQALQLALAARDAYHFLGSPEGELALAQAAVYLATAPKSNAVDSALARVRRDIQQTQALPVPLHIRNAPTRLMKDLGYGKGYKYAHNYEDRYVAQEYLPEKLRGRRYYFPSGFGFEKEIQKRIQWWSKKKRQAQKDPGRQREKEKNGES